MQSEELRPPLPFSLPFSFPLVPPSSLSKRETERRKKLRETRPLTFENFYEIFFCAPLDEFGRKGRVSGSWCR
jgi:hypothetical protein